MLEVDVHANGFDEDWPAILVVARMVDELYVECIKDASPDMQVVVAFEDVFASVVQVAVAK
jgi:hypothetical protein